jgi:putative ABC transport system permease protein
MIIAIGITSLVGILTATDSLKALVSENFGKMGANSFSIRSNFSDDQTVEKRQSEGLKRQQINIQMPDVLICQPNTV